jgi:hypothetical protein
MTVSKIMKYRKNTTEFSAEMSLSIDLTCTVSPPLATTRLIKTSSSVYPTS